MFMQCLGGGIGHLEQFPPANNESEVVYEYGDEDGNEVIGDDGGTGVPGKRRVMRMRTGKARKILRPRTVRTQTRGKVRTRRWGVLIDFEHHRWVSYPLCTGTHKFQEILNRHIIISR